MVKKEKSLKRKNTKRVGSLIIAVLLVVAYFSQSSSVIIKSYAAAATKNKAIVIIPGIAGSSLETMSGDHIWLTTDINKLMQMECNEDGTSINELRNKKGDIHLIELGCLRLETSLIFYFGTKYDVKLFTYDWRLSCSEAAIKLQQLVQPYSEVIIVAHSMGGLVASKFLANSSENRAKVSKVIAIGTPFTGSVKGLYVMETGEFASIASGLNDTFKSLAKNFPAVYELLPTKDYLKGNDPYISKTQTNGVEQTLSTHGLSWSYMRGRPWGRTSSNLVKPMFGRAQSFHNSLVVNGSHIANGLLTEYHMIIGFGQDTPSRVIYNSDGTIKKYELNNNGDGTVTTASAVYNRGSNTVLHVRTSHFGLTWNSTVIDMVKEIIKGTGSSIPSTVSKNSDNSKELYPTNEKGWLIGEDNNRTEVLVYSGKLDRMRNSKGEELKTIGNTIFLEKEDGSRETYGTVWSLGNHSYQYSFLNKEVSYEVVPEKNTEAEMVVSYMSDGYYTKSLSASDISSAFSMTVSDNNGKNIAVENEHKTSVVFVESTNEELAEMNNTR